MYTTLADRSTRKLLERLIGIDIHLIAELGYLDLRPERSNIFFRLMEERYGQKQTLITTNLDYDHWAELLGQKATVSALLDRLRNCCHAIRIEGPPLRTPNS